MISLRNVIRAPGRSLMTVLGVGAGAALFIAITAITADVRTQLGAATSAYNMEVVAYERRATSAFSSRISTAQIAELETRYGDAVSALVLGTRNEPWNPYVLVIGVPPELLRRIPLTAGALYVEGSGEILLGEIAAEKLGVGPGQAVTLDGRPRRIAGIHRIGSRLFDGGLMMSIPDAQQSLTREGAEPQYTMAVFRAPGPAAARALIAELNAQFPLLRAIPGAEFAGSLRLLRVVDAFAPTISAVSLVGAALVLTNTFLMAIAERTREIGILMAIGWTPWLVLRMLLAESVVLAGVGAALGNVAALLLLRVVNGLESLGYGWIPVRFPLGITAASLGLALAVALIALAWPAVVLHRVQPLTALRHE